MVLLNSRCYFLNEMQKYEDFLIWGNFFLFDKITEMSGVVSLPGRVVHGDAGKGKSGGGFPPTQGRGKKGVSTPFLRSFSAFSPLLERRKGADIPEKIRQKPSVTRET